MRTYFLIAVALGLLLVGIAASGASGTSFARGEGRQANHLAWIGIILILVGAAVMRIA